jgi:hypothetical protein
MKHFRFSRSFAAALLLAPFFGASSWAQVAPAPSAPATGATAATTDGAAPAPLVKVDFNAQKGIFSGDATLAPGLDGTALTLKGTGSAELAEKLDTAKSFSVMAWVKVTRAGGFQTFISSDGPTNSAFFLQMRDDTKRFAFTALPEGPDVGAQANAKEDAKIGVWTHLAGVHDAQKHTLTLYVNGVLQEAVPFEATYTAPGPLRVGRAKFGENPVDFAVGQIDDAQIFQAALTAPQVMTLVQPLLAKAAAAPATPK